MCTARTQASPRYSDVYNVLLQVLDDGRLTDGQGRTVDFKNTVLILTSNIGSGHIQSIGERTELKAEERRELTRRAVLEDVRKVFRPEFINRLDELVVFDRLSRSELVRIVDIQLQQFAARLARRELGLELTPAAKETLVDAGWDPQYGARPLKRAIRKNLEDPISRSLLGGQYPPGTTLLVDRDVAGEIVCRAKTVN